MRKIYPTSPPQSPPGEDSTFGTFWQPSIWWNALVRFAILSAFVIILSALLWYTNNLETLVRNRTRSLREEIKERKRIEREVFDLLQRQKNEIAHEIHDDLAQVLTAISFKARNLEEELKPHSPAQAKSAAQIVELLNCAVGQTRLIARGLCPAEVDAGEMVAALTRLTREIETMFQFTCHFTSNVSTLNVSPTVGTHFYRIVQQAADNATRHGRHAPSTSTLRRTSSNSIFKSPTTAADSIPPILHSAASACGPCGFAPIFSAPRFPSTPLPALEPASAAFPPSSRRKTRRWRRTSGSRFPPHPHDPKNPGTRTSDSCCR